MEKLCIQITTRGLGILEKLLDIKTQPRVERVVVHMWVKPIFLADTFNV